MAGTNDTIRAVSGNKLSGQDVDKLMKELGMSAEHIINRTKDLGIEIGEGAYSRIPPAAAPAPAPAPGPAPAPAPSPQQPVAAAPTFAPPPPPVWNGAGVGTNPGTAGGTLPLPGQPGSTPIGSVNYDGTPKTPYTPDMESFYNGTLTGPALGPINAASVAYQYSPGGERHSAFDNGGDRNKDTGGDGSTDDSYTPIDSSAEWMKYLDDAERRKQDVEPYYWDPERYASTRKYTDSGQPVAGSIFS